MYLRRLQIDCIATDGGAVAAPLRHLDSFSMRNFTNDAVFDDTLPVADGLMEAGLRVPLPLLQQRMADWFRRKGYLPEGGSLRITELESPWQHDAHSLRQQQPHRQGL